MQLKKYNSALLVLPILLFSLGFMSLLSTSPENAKNQALYFVVSAVAYIILSRIDFRLFAKVWKHLLFILVALLGLTIVAGETRFGSIRWFRLGFFVFQPSEFAKLALIIATASIIAHKNVSINRFLDLLKLFAFVLPLVALVFFQPDLGTSIIMLFSILCMLFYAGLNAWYLGGFALVAGIASNPVWNALKDYQKERILVFLNPSLDRLGMGYNVSQSLISIGAGQLMGKGFGYGSQSHLKFLPAFWTDFIFAAFAEEWGFVGVVGLIVLYSVLLLVLLNVAHKATDYYGKLICMGIFFVFFSQFIINVGMNLGLSPVTGVPLPLVSYGGSSLLTSLILLGIVQNIWVQSKLTPLTKT